MLGAERRPLVTLVVSNGGSSGGNDERQQYGRVVRPISSINMYDQTEAGWGAEGLPRRRTSRNDHSDMPALS